MGTPPSVIVVDVNETLSDLGPVAARFAEVGAPEHLARLWFAALLRDGFALTAAGASQPFAGLAEDALRGVLHGVALTTGRDAAVEHVLAGFGQLPVHDDVPDGVRALRAAGHRVVALTNGSASSGEQLLVRAGIREEFEAVLSVEDAGAWKPARAAYEHALRRCGVDAADALLVAVHPWDVDGAARAGLRTAWIDRTGAPYPASATAPALRAGGLVELAALLAGTGPAADRGGVPGPAPVRQRVQGSPELPGGAG